MGSFEDYNLQVRVSLYITCIFMKTLLWNWMYTAIEFARTRYTAFLSLKSESFFFSLMLNILMTSRLRKGKGKAPGAGCSQRCKNLLLCILIFFFSFQRLNSCLNMNTISILTSLLEDICWKSIGYTNTVILKGRHLTKTTHFRFHFIKHLIYVIILAYKFISCVHSMWMSASSI